MYLFIEQKHPRCNYEKSKFQSILQCKNNKHKNNNNFPIKKSEVIAQKNKLLNYIKGKCWSLLYFPPNCLHY